MNQPNLGENTKKHLASIMKDLSGKDDFMPFLLLNSKVGHIYVGLMMPGEEDKKDSLADTMMAVCAVHRATEAMFVSTSWMVSRKKDEGPLDMSTPPSQQPDRVEAVFMVHHTSSTDDVTTYSAPVIRKDNTVGLGEWTDSPGVKIGGRFGDAIRHGMKFGEDIPTDMAEYLDAEITAGRSEQAVKMMLRALNSARSSIQAAKN
jgi:hypothetical protein